MTAGGDINHVAAQLSGIDQRYLDGYQRYEARAAAATMAQQVSELQRESEARVELLVATQVRL